MVNCIILGRAEAFASRSGVWRSALDGLGMGLGFLIALAILGSIREVLGNGADGGHAAGVRGVRAGLQGQLGAGLRAAAGGLHDAGDAAGRPQRLEGGPRPWSSGSRSTWLIVWAVFVNNFILAQFLGICPFLGVSKKIESAMGMGLAVVFVMTVSSVVAWLLYRFLLVPLDMTYLKTLVFILVIAACSSWRW